jgi:hypothetical protein
MGRPDTVELQALKSELQQEADRLRSEPLTPLIRAQGKSDLAGIITLGCKARNTDQLPSVQTLDC